MSNDREMDTEDVIHTCNGILLSQKKEKNNMDGLRDYHTKQISSIIHM